MNTKLKQILTILLFLSLVSAFVAYYMQAFAQQRSPAAHFDGDPMTYPIDNDSLAYIRSLPFDNTRARQQAMIDFYNRSAPPGYYFNDTLWRESKLMMSSSKVIIFHKERGDLRKYWTKK